MTKSLETEATPSTEKTTPNPSQRERNKYLLTLDQPVSEFRQWWQMRPNFAGSDDSFKSWPSGNMTIASMMFSLPMLSDVTKKRSMQKNLRCFLVVTARVNGLDARSYLEFVLRAMADAVNCTEPLQGHELAEYVKKLLPWDEMIQERFLAEDPFECKAYTTDAKAVW